MIDELNKAGHGHQKRMVGQQHKCNPTRLESLFRPQEMDYGVPRWGFIQILRVNRHRVFQLRSRFGIYQPSIEIHSFPYKRRLSTSCLLVCSINAFFNNIG